MGFWPLQHLGSEFIPPLMRGHHVHAHHGDQHPVGKAREILQQTDKLIRTVPEVQNVFGLGAPTRPPTRRIW